MDKNRNLTKKESISGERPSPGKETIAEFLEALSSKNPVPSGGGATALAASLAFSLALMVGNLTLGKKKGKRRGGRGSLETMRTVGTDGSRGRE